MKLVYQLSEHLRRNQAEVDQAHALTLDESRPTLGLRGTHGLYGSDEWWRAINSGAMKTRRVRGIIQRRYATGQDGGGKINAFDLRLMTGEVVAEDIYVQRPEDAGLFVEGAEVSVLYAYDELKRQLSNGEPDRLEIVLEVEVAS